MSFGIATWGPDGDVSLNTAQSTVRGLFRTAVTGTGATNQYYSIPQITADSFVAIAPAAGQGQQPLPAAYWTAGQLRLVRAAPGKVFYVYVMG